jgi:uncharacterized protein (DUF302 family)
MDDAEQIDIVEHPSPVDFATTVAKVEGAIEAAGMTIFARIDHASGARAVGLKMPAATVLIYGNAKGGTPIMVASPRAALDLPLRVLVRQIEGGSVVLAFHPVVESLRRSGVSTALASHLEPAQRLLISALEE